MKTHKVFTVIIHNKEYDIYHIKDREHEGWNGEPKNWWIYYSDRLPEGAIPPHDSPHFKPYHTSILRRCWEFKIKQTNSTKVKWGDTDFRNHISVEMWCNGKHIYSFGTSGKAMDYAFAKIQYLIVEMSEHPYNFFEPELDNGRKIYWKGLPATIVKSYHPGEIRIRPDYTCGLDKKAWWDELKRRETMIGKTPDDFDEIEKENREEDFHSDEINWGDALSDQHINWFRK